MEYQLPIEWIETERGLIAEKMLTQARVHKVYAPNGDVAYCVHVDVAGSPEMGFRDLTATEEGGKAMAGSFCQQLGSWVTNDDPALPQPFEEIVSCFPYSLQ